MTTFGQLLEELKQTEITAVGMYHDVRLMRAEGIATSADFATYDQLRHTLFAAQTSLVGMARVLVASAAPPLVDQLPQPKMLPAVNASTAGSAPGLGNPAFLIAAVIIGLLTVAAILWLFDEIVTNSLEILGMMQRVRARAAQYRQLLQARQAAYAACLGSGAGPDACAAHAVDIAPTPGDANLPIREANPTRPSSKFWWGAGSVVALGLLGWWAWARYAPKAPSAGVRGLGAPHRVQDLDGSKSRYNLEV